MATAQAAERLCRDFHPITDASLYDTRSKAIFGFLVCLHFILAALCALHMYMRWTNDYIKLSARQQTLQTSRGQPPESTTATRELASLMQDTEAGGRPALIPSTGSSPELKLTSRMRMKLFVFTASNLMLHLFLSTSWLFWLLSNLLLSDIKSPASLQQSIELRAVFFACFPVGILFSMISDFAFSDRFAVLCISKQPTQQERHRRRISSQCIS